jgi:hypothetical protein
MVQTGHLEMVLQVAITTGGKMAALSLALAFMAFFESVEDWLSFMSVQLFWIICMRFVIIMPLKIK